MRMGTRTTKTEIQSKLFFLKFCHTVAADELLCLKNVGTQISLDFSWNEGLAHICSYQLDRAANPANLAQKGAKWAKLAVLFIW